VYGIFDSEFRTVVGL